VAEALKKRDWVLMANKLYTPRGKTLDIADNRNCYMQVKGDIVYIQLSFNGMQKDNNISGLTLQGIPYNIDSTSDKHGNITYSFDVDGHNLSTLVKIHINYNDNYAQVTIHPHVNRKSISISGWMLPSDKARFYTSGYVNY
ncbi:MAG: DUF4251 domain-containing protein, partial [Odoribacter sp.]|nr:DUF4251 domain-containing protein [Odoribacter sp.]